MKDTHLHRHLRAGLLALAFIPSLLHAVQTDIPGPAGSERFGTSVTVLPNGNIVVTDPKFDLVVADVGRVYLLSPTGVVISTLTGSTAGDQVGAGGVTVLSNGNFVVRTPFWNDGGVISAGAATWGSSTTGFIGGASVTVSAANSLVGSAINDRVGNGGVTALSNGNYVVSSANWNNSAGAATWGNGTSGTVGVVSVANSLIGTAANNSVSNSGVAALTNGNYVVRSANWDNGATSNAGAVTWGDGASGTAGVVSVANSLIGSAADDLVGNSGVTALTNGNYVVRSANWDNGALADAGAVTWGDGATGIAGAVSSANSLIGSTANDLVGSNPVTALTHGHYVVRSAEWDNGAMVDAGAATWGHGATGITGTISAANSLIGSAAGDKVGTDVIALTNGNYVVRSPNWDNGAVTDAGAVTWGDGTAGVIGVISAANSLIGSTFEDFVGMGVTALTNGNYVVRSAVWDNSATVNAGAVTWGSGVTGISGVVSAANSLVGSTAVDQVGAAGVFALTNGNYVVCSSNWDNGAATEAGAATWGNGTTGIKGVVSAANSLVGSSSNDVVGNIGVTVLTNGNYVVRSQSWDGAAPNVGAVTWGNGSTGVTGVVSAANSLVGSTNSDTIGSAGVAALANGNYMVRSQNWDNGAATNAGAVTWGNGATGTTGVVSAANSLVGSTTNDSVGGGSSFATFPNGTYIVYSPNWDNGATANAGAVTLGSGASGTSGIVSAANSVLGTVANGGPSLSFGYDASREQLVVGRGDSNVVSLFTPGTGVGTLAFDSTLFTVKEEDLAVFVPIVRSGGAKGTASVTFQTTPGTATAGAGGDYMPDAGQVVNFADGEFSKTVFVPILNGNAVNEANEIFGVSLTNASGAALGSPSTAIVRIIEQGDSTDPGAPVITTPAANALVGVNAGATTSIKGSAMDNKGIALVEVQLNDEVFKPATLSNISGTSATWTIDVTPVTGSNIVRVRSTDTRGRTSGITTRTFKAGRPLVVTTSGAGTVTAGFEPTSFREVGTSLTLTATATAIPAPGTIFTGWSVTGPNITQMGMTPAALEKPTLSFVFREGLQLVAGFAPNPFTNIVTGSYKGLVLASPTLPDRAPAGAGSEDGTVPDNGTEGFFAATMQSTGAFSGKLTIDGLVANVAGTFDHLGNARFGSARTLTAKIPRVGKPSLVFACKIDGTVPFNIGTLSGTVIAVDFHNAAAAVSTFTAERAHFNGTTLLVPGPYLGASNANGIFNVVFAARPVGDQPVGYQENYYPQGDGIGTLTVTKAGMVTLSNCTLADGTVATASTTLSQALTCPLFLPLYGNKGYLRANITLDNTQATSDLSVSPGTDATWLRPAQNTHYYAAGWPEVIKVGLLGAKYTVTAGQSVVKAADGADAGNAGDNVQPADNDGNVELQFDDGQLDGLLIKYANVSTADVATKVPANDPTFTLTLSRATGIFSGTFRHSDSTLPAFKGIIYQKGPTAGGFGHFLTKQPTPIDYTGEGGGVSLSGQP